MKEDQEEVYPETVSESLELLKEVQDFMKSKTYDYFLRYLNADIRRGTKMAVSTLPSSIGAFLQREQAFGGLERLNDLLDWFEIRAQAIQEHIIEISAKQKEQTILDNE